MTMQMAEGLDTGDILLEARTEVGSNETAGELYARLAPMGAEPGGANTGRDRAHHAASAGPQRPRSRPSSRATWRRLTGLSRPRSFMTWWGFNLGRRPGPRSLVSE